VDADARRRRHPGRVRRRGPLRGAMRLAQPLVKRMVGREFAGYHENLRRNVEGA